jgi:hypothetical protein
VGRLDDRAGGAVAEVTPSQTKAASPIAEVLAELSEQESLVQVEITAHTKVAKTGHFRIDHADGFVNRRGPFRDGRNSPNASGAAAKVGALAWAGSGVNRDQTGNDPKGNALE